MTAKTRPSCLFWIFFFLHDYRYSITAPSVYQVTCNLMQVFNGMQNTQPTWGVRPGENPCPRCTKNWKVWRPETQLLGHCSSYCIIKGEFLYCGSFKKGLPFTASNYIVSFWAAHCSYSIIYWNKDDLTEFWQVFKREIWLQNQEIQKILLQQIIIFPISGNNPDGPRRET